MRPRGRHCHPPTVNGKKAMRQQVDTARRGREGPDLEPVLAALLNGAARIASYVGTPGEPFVTPRPGWLLPVLLPDDDLDWAVHEGPLARGRRGVPEPTGPRLGVDAISSCDLVLVPALAVDRAGHRLGKGGGSFDRALARATGLTVALLHDDELVEAVPHEPHDVPVRGVATLTGGVVLFS